MAWFSVNVYHHIVPNKGTEELLKSISEKIDYLTLKINEMATKQERFDTVLSRIDAVTTEIAQDYQTLLDEVRNGTVSDASLERAEQNIARLEAIAKSNDTPVPGEEIPPADEEPTNNGGNNAGNS
jgi:DNA repair ATPase RecN